MIIVDLDGSSMVLTIGAGIQKYLVLLQANVRQEPKASVNAAYKTCDLAYKILKV